MSSGYEPIDNYEIASFIAGGGTSQVFEVIEPGTHRRLAMKLINNDHPDVKEHKAALKAEAVVCKALDHPNVIHYEGFISGRDYTYMLMEYFRAPTLKVQLKLDVLGVHLRMKRLLDGVCAALQHVHDRGFIHRDMKPENVLMNKVGEVRLIDFSLAVRMKTGLAAMFGGKKSQIQGTRTYIAPETIRKQNPVLQTDLYSLGILLFEVLTGKTPFQAPTPNELLQKHLSAPPPNASEFNPNVTPEMDRLIAKLLSKKPEQRGKDMAEISAELRRIRVFKEEIQEAKSSKVEDKPVDLLDQLSSGKVDSRLDAKRSQLVRENPELASQLADQQRTRQAANAAKKANLDAIKKQGLKPAAAVPAAPAPVPAPPIPVMAPPQPYPYPYPAQPGYPMQVPQPMAYQPPPGYPGGPLPGMPPGYPPQMLPPAPVVPPPTPVPIVPGFPNAPVPVTMPLAPPVAPPPVAAPALAAMLLPAAAKPVPAPIPPSPAPAPAPVPPQQAAAEEPLDYMTELPDIL